MQSSKRQLRQEAEARLFEGEELLPEPLDLKNSRRLLRELRVHQIELEIQNKELRRSQEELEESRNRYQDLYNFAPAGYMTIDEAGLIIEANFTAAVLLEEEGMLVGQPILKFILADDQDIYYHHRTDIFKTQERQSCKLRLLRKDHPPFWARLETVPTGENGPEQSACWIMLSDISRGMRSAEQTRLSEDRTQQQQKVESLECMAAAIAHFFNNQLSVIIGNLELAVEALPTDEDGIKYIVAAMGGARKAAEMGRSMLTYLSKAGDVTYEPVDFVETCRNALKALRLLIPKNISVSVDFLTDGLIINANATQIGQVVNNVVTNAWESLSGGEGTVEVRIQLIKSVDIPQTHRFPVGWQPRKGVYACLQITDNGCGLDTAEIVRIFDPFYTRKFIGRGLGLPLVMGIVRAHQGGITVVAQRDKGSVFRVFFPVHREQCAGEPTAFPEKRPSRMRGDTEKDTILVVDDEPTHCLTAKTVFPRFGYKVIIATSGEKAVSIFEGYRKTIDCVLYDLIEPIMDGFGKLVLRLYQTTSENGARSEACDQCIFSLLRNHGMLISWRALMQNL